MRRERAALLAREDVTVVARLGERIEVVAEVGHKRPRDGEDAPSGVGLGWEDEVVAVAVELALADDGHLAAVEVEVEVTAPQSENLASAEADEGGEEHDASHPLRELLDDLVDLVDGRDGAFVGRFDAGALDGAGVRRDQAVLDGGHQDRAEQAVALGRGAGAGSAAELRPRDE